MFHFLSFLSSLGIKKILSFSLSSSSLPFIHSFQSHLAIPPSALMSVEIIYSSTESPRISFSYDLNQNDVVPSHDTNSLLDPTFDFNFNFHNFDFSTPQNFPFDLSSADEIFSNGVILPAQIKPNKQTKTQETETTQDPNNSPEQSSVTTSKKNKKKKKKKKKIMRLKEFLSCTTDTEEEEDDKPSTKSFWQFRRSSSLNNVGTLINRPLQFLSRSKSTGSAPNPKPTTGKQNQTKRSAAVVFSRSSSCNSYYPYNNSSKRALPALKKSYSRSYDNGIRVSPVLHISHACIAKGTASFFGFAAFFCTGKSRTNRKSFFP